MKAIFVKRFNRILEIACHNDVEVLIQGAFGCDVFYSLPELVADAATEALNTAPCCPEIVEFAVHCTLRHVVNFLAFDKYFKGKT